MLHTPKGKGRDEGRSTHNQSLGSSQNLGTYFRQKILEWVLLSDGFATGTLSFLR